MLATGYDGSWSRLSTTKILSSLPVNRAPFLLSSPGWSHHIILSSNLDDTQNSVPQPVRQAPVLLFVSHAEPAQPPQIKYNGTQLFGDPSTHIVFV
jgi:hypothetical protein